MTDIKLIFTMSENWTLVEPRDVAGQVQLAVEAEKAGFDGAMVSDHIVLGKGADEVGLPLNIRDYAQPGNQNPATPWPSNVVLMSAVAAVTDHIRIISGAMIAPLRHPLILAKDLATLDLLSKGRLVVLPSVSWHKSEYDALGVPFHKRGKVLNEQLEILKLVWSGSPASFEGDFFNFDTVWVEPGPYRPGGPPLWFGGDSANKNLLHRLSTYGSGHMGNGATSREDFDRIVQHLNENGRSIEEIELVGGFGAKFEDAESTVKVDDVLWQLLPQLKRGIRTFNIKPSQYTDDISEMPSIFSEFVEKAGNIAADFKV